MSFSDLYKDGDNVYYNINIINNTNEIKLARYDETRRDIIICDPNEYYITIARFTVPLNSVPLLIMPMKEGSVTQTTLKVTLTHLQTNTDYMQTVQYLPDNNLSFTDPKYFYVYTYQKFITLVNIALRQAYNALIAVHSVDASSEAPYFIFNPETQLISLIATKNYDINGYIPTPPPILPKTATEEIQIWANSELLSYFEALRVYFNSFGVDKAGQFLITANPNNENGYNKFGTAPSDPPDYIKLVQEYKTIEYWNGFKNLLFSTNLLPIRNEYIPTVNNADGVNNFFPILTDFEPLLGNAGDTRSILNYVADGQYRLTDILGSDCIRKFDLQLYWVDNKNVFRPLELYPNTQIKVKLLFVRKSLYKRGVYIEN